MSHRTATLLVEGWRGIAHSYALVNQFQLVEFSRMAGVRLFHRDSAFLHQEWMPAAGLFPAETEAMIRAVSAPPLDLVPDAVFRIAYPYNFSPLGHGRLIVFGTAECSVCPPNSVVGAGNGQIGPALEESKAILLTPSEWSRRGFIRSGANPECVKVVPHGVDSSLFNPVSSSKEKARLRGKLGLSIDDFVFLNIGSLTPNKGILVLLKAFLEVVVSHPRARLVLKYNGAIYSPKALMDSLPGAFSVAEQAILGPKIQLIGGLHSLIDLASLYRASDAYAAPYYAEGFNLPALEAAACGLPVLGTAGGPTDEFLPPGVLLPIESLPMTVVRDGGEMIVLQPKSESLVHQMNFVLTDRTIAPQARVIGPKHVVEYLSWQKVCAQIARIAFE